MKLRMTALALLASSASGSAVSAEVKLLNVSYDPTRELYQEYNQAFAKYWKPRAAMR